MNYIKWKIEEIKKYILNSKPEIQTSDVVRLGVEKMTSDTYANETTYTGEQFILLDIYPTTNGTVSITYGGLTKTITDTSGVEEPNAQQVFFGTFNGISDSVETPLSGELTIEGDYRGFAVGSFKSSKYATIYYTGINEVFDFGKITEILIGAFQNCSKLLTVTIPNSITTINRGAFQGTGLTSITIPSSVTSINTEGNLLLSSNPFAKCRNLLSVIVDKTNSVYDSRNNCNAIIRTSDNYLISGCQNTIIPNNVVIIGEEAFNGCTSLESIVIPNSVTSIEGSAFYGCTSLTKIVIPNSVTNIGNAAFGSCTSLESIVIPNSVTSIGNVFTGCTSLTSITIPNSVTSIGINAFRECTGLTNVTFANTSGWYVTKTQGATSGTVVDVSNSTNNATLFTDTYREYYWYRS